MGRVKLAVFVTALCLAGFQTGEALAQSTPLKLPKQIILATDREGGTGHTMGAGFASVLGKHSGTNAVVLPIGDPGKWVGMMKNSEVDFGMTSSTNLSAVYWGTQAFEGKGNKDFSLVALGAPSTWGFMIPEDAPVNTPAELKQWVRGKRLSHNWINPAINHLNLAGLANLGFPNGLEEAGLIAVPVSSYQVFVNLWVEGKVDIIGTTHAPIVQQMYAARPSKFIAMNEDSASVERMQKVEPAFYISPHPRDTTAAKKGTPFLTFDYALVVRNDIEKGLVEHVLETIRKNQPDWVAVHPLVNGWFPAKDVWPSANAPFPFHPEAVAYYKKQGWWNDKVEAKQAALLARAKK